MVGTEFKNVTICRTIALTIANICTLKVTVYLPKEIFSPQRIKHYLMFAEQIIRLLTRQLQLLLKRNNFKICFDNAM